MEGVSTWTHTSRCGRDGWLGQRCHAFFRWIEGISVDPYAEGVTFRSPGQAKPLCGVAPPWETVHSESITLKALHNRYCVT